MVRQICIVCSKVFANVMQKNPIFSKDHGTCTKQYKHYKSQDSSSQPSSFSQNSLCAEAPLFHKHHWSCPSGLVISLDWSSVQ